MSTSCACKTSPGTHTFFPSYTRHVYRKRFRAAIGLWLEWQSYPRLRPDMISVRRARVLPPPSFRFRLATDTLGFGYDLPAAGRSRDFHPLERALAGRTIYAKSALDLGALCLHSMRNMEKMLEPSRNSTKLQSNHLIHT